MNTIELNLKYIYINVSDLGIAEEFYLRVLGCRTIEDFLFMAHKHIIMDWPDQQSGLVLIENLAKFTPSRILLKTADCLKEYFRISSYGIEFKSRPSYHPNGLIAEFEDPCGNLFLIWEQRSY